jgi:hypothetical protein
VAFFPGWSNSVNSRGENPALHKHHPAFGMMIAVYPDFRISENGPISIAALLALRFYF